MPPRYFFAASSRNLFGIFCIIFTGVIIWLSFANARAGASPKESYLPFLLRLWPAPPPTPSPGRVVISEVLYRPTGDEPQAEWIEIFNAGGMPVDLSSYKLGDEETPGGQEGMLQFPYGTVIGPGRALVIAYKATLFSAAYGTPPDFEMRESDATVPNMIKYLAYSNGNVELVNSGDEVILLNAAEVRADAVSWGDSPHAFDPPVKGVAAGHSIERSPGYVDTDTSTDWIDQPLPAPWSVDISTLTPTPSPTGNLQDTPTPPAHTGLLISEVFYDPTGDEPHGEWIEIFNAGNVGVSLSGYKLGDEETSEQGEGMAQFPESATLGPGEVAIIANRASYFYAAYGFLPTYELYDTDPLVPVMIHYSIWGTGSINLNNSGDEVLILDWTDKVVDAVSWGSSAWAFAPPVEGVAQNHSIERKPAQIDTNTALDWINQAVPAPGSVDLTLPTSTPTRTPSPLPSPTSTSTNTPTTQLSPTATLKPTSTHTPEFTPMPLLVINEILASPDSLLGDANGDGSVNYNEDEFVELVNTGSEPLDVSGWAIHDDEGLRHLFPGGSVILPGCSILVFGGGSPTGSFGNSLVQTASSASLSLDNWGDTLRLFDASSVLRNSYTYGMEGGHNGQSLNRNPDITGLDPLVYHTLVSGSESLIFSPGTLANGTPFAGCPAR